MKREIKKEKKKTTKNQANMVIGNRDTRGV